LVSNGLVRVRFEPLEACGAASFVREIPKIIEARSDEI
jgi:hypothetical protein